MELNGVVTSGLGVAKKWVSKIENTFEKKTKIKLFHGTLNIRLEEDYIIKPDWTINPEEYGGTQKVLIKKCKLLDTEAYIVRAEKNQTGQGDYDLKTVEIISDINFREKYNLQDGKTVTILI